VCLLDLDPLWPSVAQRLDVPAHPNLRSLADAVLHGGEVGAHLHQWGSAFVVGGVGSHRAAHPLPHHEVTMVLESLAETFPVVVADVGAEDRCQGVILRGFDAVILVANGDPVSLTRLMKVAERMDDLLDHGQLVAAVNKAPRRRFHRGEIRTEVNRSLPGIPLLILPFDERVTTAVWDGKPTARGAFTREVERIADLVVTRSA
jgi:MinD-like ATPase involved in chromosome partitioning or flagellar assembly